jgi:1-acyl-sn-glycerol-3-phosphate acyltransferase
VLDQLGPALRQRLRVLGDVLRVLEPPERLDRFGMDERLEARAAPLVEFLYATWWRVVVRGLEHVPAEGGAVVVANHAGLFPWDALVLRHALRRDHPGHRSLRPLLDDAACDRPLAGAAAVRLGAVRASPESAARLLQAGELVAVFPEGSAAEGRPWRERYRLGRFGRGGFAKVAARAGVPVIPCAVVGGAESAPPLASPGYLADLLRIPPLVGGGALRIAAAAAIPLPARWSLTFGPPLALGGQPASADDPGWAAAASERARGAVQALLDEALAARRSVYL